MPNAPERPTLASRAQKGSPPLRPDGAGVDAQVRLEAEHRAQAAAQVLAAAKADEAALQIAAVELPAVARRRRLVAAAARGVEQAVEDRVLRCRADAAQRRSGGHQSGADRSSHSEHLVVLASRGGERRRPPAFILAEIAAVSRWRVASFVVAATIAFLPQPIRVEILVNGAPRPLPDDLADPALPLLWALRDVLGLTGTKFGCGVAACGACTVHLDGEAVRSCVRRRSARSQGRRVVTIEALGSARGCRIRCSSAWVAHQVPQCGYCQSGMLMAAAALLAKNREPSDAEIDAAITNICRCGTYPRVRAAIRARRAPSSRH